MIEQSGCRHHAEMWCAGCVERVQSEARAAGEAAGYERGRAEMREEAAQEADSGDLLINGTYSHEARVMAHRIARAIRALPDSMRKP